MRPLTSSILTTTIIISRPTRCEKSLTECISTNLSGKNALSTPILTDKPPLTTPVTRPVTISSEFIDTSRDCQSLMRLASTYDNNVLPRPSSIDFRATSTTSPSAISNSPCEFLNSSSGIKPSDCNPTLIIAFSRLMLTIVPFNKEPIFGFSCFCLFSNSSVNVLLTYCTPYTQTFIHKIQYAYFFQFPFTNGKLI